ncbi:MAG: phytanoyl-CoA dioxygenase family protein [Sphingomonadaceae bacterium]|uniref:phytanoyl-CoA dioxygenase family protein n=1 Tax=Thermaurantiacus sp. TaxID=2820283 RepID=UPI00298F2510|nr:phytanoyl-CoA dioxygenase family protein [Thermaurantiacus sp.]MCS6987577.1 phytanoyl-CoA dioxygenase family protein [Sphingomonadaceae bacterium]MDW8415178.1 phytanoyl-CoA dioxygenase family protein [Thermaurantiacus sp.]
MRIGPEHVAQYAAEGCTRIEGAFDARWVERLLAAIERCRAAFATGCPPRLVGSVGPRNPPSIHRTGEGGIQLRNCMSTDTTFLDWLRSSPAAELVGRITGARSVRFWMDATFIKEAADPGTATPWHNDVCTFPFQGEQQPSLWVALTDVGPEDAPLLTLAGSNHDRWRYHSPLSRQDVRLPGYRPWDELLARATAPDADIRVWTARAGDALLIHPRTIHASRAAGRGRRRVAFTTRWLGSDVVWAPDALSVHVAGLSDHPAMVPGAPPPDALFPVLWQA